MDRHALILAGVFLISLVLAAVSFSLIGKIEKMREKMVVPALILSSVFFSVVSLSVLLFWYQFDFVNNINYRSFLIPLTGIVLICGAMFINIRYAVSTAVLVSTLISVFGGGLEIVFFTESSRIINQLFTVIIWSFFALGYRALAGLNPLPQCEGLTVSIGFSLLYLFGVVPFMMEVMAVSLLAILLIAYIYKNKLPFGIASVPVLGYIIGWFGVLSYGEYLLPSFIIFVTFYLIELTICTIRKVLMLSDYKDFHYNSISVQVFVDGISPYEIIKTVWFTNIVLVVMGAFQINSNNPYSIPIFVVLIVVWQLYRMINWQHENKTLKEVNRELVTDIKKSINNMFNSNNDTDKE